MFIKKKLKKSSFLKPRSKLYFDLRIEIAQGKDIDKPDEYGCTNIINASETADFHSIKLLIKQKANLNRQTFFKTGVFFNLLDEGELAIIKFLTFYGLNLNIRNEYNETGLIWAVKNNLNKEVNFLLEENPLSINDADSNKKTALHYAFKNKQYAMIKLLIKHGARINIYDGDGNPPFFYIDYNSDCTSILNFLYKKGMDINITNSEGENLLFKAVYNDNYQLVNFLLKKKININALNTEQKDALYYAKKQNNEKIIALLLNSRKDK